MNNSKLVKNAAGVNLLEKCQKTDFEKFCLETMNELRFMSMSMQRLGGLMDFYGGLGEIGDHGRELIGASKIAAGWADGIQKELASGLTKASPPQKLKEQAKVTTTRRRAQLQKPSRRPA